ncbi:MAG: Gfo/Idh/MocA family protein, partial [Pyrinomonadaceae bacterium]
MEKKNDRREFIKRAGAGVATIAASASRNLFASGAPASTTTGLQPLPASSASRILGANDRINIGFVGCGGRMNTHIDYIVHRAKEKGDVQAVAVNDIYERNKKEARERSGVAEKDVHHQYEELCARKDIDVVVVSSPDHWHHNHALEALRNGKDVYLEKPMTYTVDEAKNLADYVKANKRILQVGSQYTSLDHFHKAR